MLKKELADALGISGAMVSKLAKRGMPTDSLERAQRWRKRHLEPGRVKGQRMGTTAPPDVKPQASRPAAPSDEAMRANHLMGAAASILSEGGDVTAMLPAIRAALRAVPEASRDDVRLHVDTMKLLIGPAVLDEMSSFRPADAGGAGHTYPAAPDEPMTGDVLQDMGIFLYSVAAGEVQILPKPTDPETDLLLPTEGELEWPEGWDKLPEY